MNGRKLIISIIVVILVITAVFVCCRRRSGDEGEPTSTYIVGTTRDDGQGIVVYNPNDFEVRTPADN